MALGGRTLMLRQRSKADANGRSGNDRTEARSAAFSAVYVVDTDLKRIGEVVQQLRQGGYAVEPFTSVGALLARLDSLEPGCILSGMSVGAADGKALMDGLGQQGCPFPVVALAPPGDVRAAVQAMKAGAVDVLTLPLDGEELQEVLRLAEHAMLRGRGAADQPELARRRIARLTRRERQVLEGMVRGEGNKAIAHELGISPRTVEVHRAKVMDKLSCRSLPEIVRLALQAGLDGA